MNKKDVPIPDGWILCKSKSNPGRQYYFNKKTGKSSWSVPQDNDTKHKLNQNRVKKKEKVDPLNVKKQKVKRLNDTKAQTTTLKRQRKQDNKKICKNLANSRLQTLRDSLTADIAHENSSHHEKSSTKKQNNVCSTQNREESNSKMGEVNTTTTSEKTLLPNQHDQNKTPVKNFKTSTNDTKCQSGKSPNNDNSQTMSSPSQFFAANRIISSMKAQLPEEFLRKEKQKDTFADIEEGISNQKPEFPTKHPSTPPQFFEASKLVSAIKLKLSYTKQSDIKTSSFANDRMNSLRNRLSNETNNVDLNDLPLTNNNRLLDEQMDVEDIEESPDMNNSLNTSNIELTEDVLLVVDTNVFIHKLEILKNILESHVNGLNEQPTLLVPWRVINELDRLKDNNNGAAAICKRARDAMDYLYKSLPENSRIKGQSLRDANSHIYPCESPDDEILNCCLQQKDRGKSVILLSNDKNLCNKAAINNVKCTSISELKQLFVGKSQPNSDQDVGAIVKNCENAIFQLLSNILENEMRAKYNNIWKRVVFKEPPWNLSDVLQCLLKHWIAVFNEVFPRINHLINDLHAVFTTIERKVPKLLSESEVSNFKEMCLEIAKKCQIIPEYMQLAKTTIDQIKSKISNSKNKNEMEKPLNSDNKNEDDTEISVINAFEALWTVLSSYCAKLSTGLGISHSLEDKLPSEDTLEVTIDKLPYFDKQLFVLLENIQRILSEDDISSVDESITRLHSVFKENVLNITIDFKDLNTFCSKRKDMLQEAGTKFVQLKELLEMCKNSIVQAMRE